MTQRQVEIVGSGVEAAREVVRALRQAGFEALFAGGCVRDALLGRLIADVDIATSATPDQVERLFAGRTVPVGKAFGVVVVLHGRFSFEVATFRLDGKYADGRHPDGVTFASAEEDAKRRDFTINAMFGDPESGRVVDDVGGLADLDARVIRAVGDPAVRFREDRLRMMRAVRFASVLGFRIDAATLSAVAAHAADISDVSAERIAAEFVRLLCESPKPSVGLNLLRETGLLVRFLPEVQALYGTRQPPRFHPEGDVWTHTCLMLDETPVPRDPDLAWGILLHDVGKPATACEQACEEGGMRIRFPNHAPVGARMAEAILSRLRQPVARIDAVRALVAGHMQFMEAPKMRRAKLRRFLGADGFHNMLELMRLDVLYSNKDFGSWRFLRDSFESFRTEPVLPPPLVRGRDLVAWGVPPGPEVGRLLGVLYDEQLDGRLTTLEEARARVARREDNSSDAVRPQPD